MELRGLHGQPEFVHQIEGVIAAQAGEVKVLGEYQQQQNADGQRHFIARQGLRGLLAALACVARCWWYQRLTCSSTMMPSSAASMNQLRWPLP